MASMCGWDTLVQVTESIDRFVSEMQSTSHRDQEARPTSVIQATNMPLSCLDNSCIIHKGSCTAQSCSAKCFTLFQQSTVRDAADWQSDYNLLCDTQGQSPAFCRCRHQLCISCDDVVPSIGGLYYCGCLRVIGHEVCYCYQALDTPAWL